MFSWSENCFSKPPTAIKATFYCIFENINYFDLPTAISARLELARVRYQYCICLNIDYLNIDVNTSLLRMMMIIMMRLHAYKIANDMVYGTAIAADIRT